MSDAGVPGRRDSAVSLPDVVQSTPIRGQRRLGAIGRPIIDHDDLQIPIRLIEHTGNRGPDVRSLVVGSDDYADARRHQSGHAAPSRSTTVFLICAMTISRS